MATNKVDMISNNFACDSYTALTCPVAMLLPPTQSSCEAVIDNNEHFGDIAIDRGNDGTRFIRASTGVHKIIDEDDWIVRDGALNGSA